jgi:hypothetical protein
VSGFQYFMLFPSFINIFTIFSLCKVRFRMFRIGLSTLEKYVGLACTTSR